MPPEKMCKNCGKPILSQGSKYCSYECRSALARKKYHEANPFKGTSSATTGAISELRVAVDLMIKGYNVFRSLSPSCPCDLAVLREGVLLKIEVRTAHRSTTGKLYNLKSSRDDVNNIDHYAWVTGDEIIYEPNLPR